MWPIDRVPPQLRANPEFQSALVRMGFWGFSICYIGIGAVIGAYDVPVDHYVELFAAYLVLNTAILISVLLRAEWNARRYLSQIIDIVAVSLAIYLTGDPFSSFYLIYIWIFISAGTRYGRAHLGVAAASAVLSYSAVIMVLGVDTKQRLDLMFHLLVLVLLPLYQDSLLRKLRRARQAAEQANKAKSNFLANMTHELRTPLTGVLGMARLLRDSRLDAEQKEYVDGITSSANMLHALIGDILDLSKIDARKLQLEATVFDLRGPIKEVCDLLQGQALTKGLEMICDIGPSVPYRVRGDELRLRQILFNLVGNAVKFTEHGEVMVRARIGDPVDALPERHVVIEVTDTGIGIPADKLSLIFESFSQADASTTRRYGGTGLGTTIARDLTQLMGGRIEVVSEPGKGSRFTVRLPLIDREGLPLPSTPDPALQGRRVLIYERDPAMRELIAETCRDLGMVGFDEYDIGRLAEMVQAADGVDLLIVADTPDRLDLARVVETLRRVLDAQVPALLLIYAPRRCDLAELGAECLTKPFLRHELAAAIHRAIESERPARPAALPSRDAARRPAGSSTPACAAPTPSSPPPAPADGSAGVRILVAEDNDIAAKVITTLLAKQGAEVSLTTDGQQALELALSDDHHFDLAFIDLRMPGLDGIGFTEALRDAEGDGQRLPVVALTANAAEDVKKRCLDAGMDAFLTKPVEPTSLAEMVRRYSRDASPS